MGNFVQADHQIAINENMTIYNAALHKPMLLNPPLTTCHPKAYISAQHYVVTY